MLARIKSNTSPRLRVRALLRLLLHQQRVQARFLLVELRGRGLLLEISVLGGRIASEAVECVDWRLIRPGALVRLPSQPRRHLSLARLQLDLLNAISTTLHLYHRNRRHLPKIACFLCSAPCLSTGAVFSNDGGLENC